MIKKTIRFKKIFNTYFYFYICLNLLIPEKINKKKY